MPLTAEGLKRWREAQEREAQERADQFRHEHGLMADPEQRVTLGDLVEGVARRAKPKRSSRRW